MRCHDPGLVEVTLPAHLGSQDGAQEAAFPDHGEQDASRPAAGSQRGA